MYTETVVHVFVTHLAVASPSLSTASLFCCSNSSLKFITCDHHIISPFFLDNSQWENPTICRWLQSPYLTANKQQSAPLSSKICISFQTRTNV